MSDENVSPNSEKEEKGGNFHFFSDKPHSKKNNGAIDRCVPQTCTKWQPVKFRQLVNFDRPQFWPGML